MPSPKSPSLSELALPPILETPLPPSTLSCLNPSLIWWVAPYQTGLGWTNAFLSTSLGGLRVSLHFPAAYIGSVSSSQLLVSEILGYYPSRSTQVTEASCEFLLSSRHLEWCSPDTSDFPFRQCHLSRAVNQFTFDSLLSNAPSSHLKALALPFAIPMQNIGSMWSLSCLRSPPP